MPDESTTPDLVELARRQLEAANRHDLDAFMSVFAPDAVYDASRDGIGVYEGPPAIRELIGGWWGTFDDLRLTPEEVRDLGSGVLFASIRHDARPVGSTAQVSTRQAYVFVFQGGKVAHVTVYSDPDEGRAGAERLAQERDWSMSEDNMKIVREMYEAFNRGDAERAVKLLHPEPELHQAPEVIDAEAYVGLEAFARGMTLFTEDWDDPRLEPQDVEAVGDCVLMRVRVSGRGNRTGLEMTTEFFHAWAFRDGKPCRCFVRSTRDEALKAVGLED
jgi:ketosteroid isomerase-like protein